jgi:hypothetical protein
LVNHFAFKETKRIPPWQVVLIHSQAEYLLIIIISPKISFYNTKTGGILFDAAGMLLLSYNCHPGLDPGSPSLSHVKGIAGQARNDVKSQLVVTPVYVVI